MTFVNWLMSYRLFPQLALLSFGLLEALLLAFSLWSVKRSRTKEPYVKPECSKTAFSDFMNSWAHRGER
jgi:hypothetical protein